jgi:acyl-CoA synthetase (AMP-forming)/AMP-acid ligase II
LKSEVAKYATILKSKFNIQKGDRVLIYMPMVPNAAIAMLACARIGAIHSVVFGGFAAKELANRIDDCQPKLIITCSVGLEPKKIIKSVFIEEAELKNLIDNKSQAFLFAGIKEDDSKFIPVNQQIYIASFFKRFNLNTDFLVPIEEIECTPLNETLWRAYDELTFILTKVINLVISVYLLDYETVMIKRNLFKIYYYIIENLVIINLTKKTKQLLKIINTVPLMRAEFQKDENPYYRYLDFLFIIYARSYTIVTQTTKGLLQLNQAIIDLSYFLNMKIFNKDNTLNSEILSNVNYSDKIFDELLEMAKS